MFHNFDQLPLVPRAHVLPLLLACLLVTLVVSDVSRCPRIDLMIIEDRRQGKHMLCQRVVVERTSILAAMIDRPDRLGTFSHL